MKKTDWNLQKKTKWSVQCYLSDHFCMWVSNFTRTSFLLALWYTIGTHFQIDLFFTFLAKTHSKFALHRDFKFQTTHIFHNILLKLLGRYEEYEESDWFNYSLNSQFWGLTGITPEIQQDLVFMYKDYTLSPRVQNLEHKRYHIKRCDEFFFR